MTRPLSILLASYAVATVSGQGLHDLAVAAGLEFFGTATEANNLDDDVYQSVLRRPGEYGMLVPENSQKWESIQPTEGDFQFDDADAVLNLATENSQQLRCHTLTWHSQLPDFVENGAWTRETLTAVIETHIANTMSHYRGACSAWDVVNEALEDDGTFRNSVFFETLGTDFIPISFAAAAEADPDARLYYNDFGLEFGSDKTDGAVEIVELVQDAGVRIDGVGFQAHMVVGETPSQDELTAVLGRFAALGVEVAFTELDIRHSPLPADEAAVQQQADDYVTVVKTCVDLAACVGVLVWQFTDRYSWIPDTFPGDGDACLLDEDFNPKPAYTSVSELLASSATVSPAPASSSVVVGDWDLAVPSESADDFCEEELFAPEATDAVDVLGGSDDEPSETDESVSGSAEEQEEVSAAGISGLPLGAVVLISTLTCAAAVMG